ncbi:MAG TPA: HEAT repeat domain-containing protein [Bryobacteraceae bacterium]|nr:HEAT repeat domain-containing protein [Bryobacteraceae bacterium]
MVLAGPVSRPSGSLKMVAAVFATCMTVTGQEVASAAAEPSAGSLSVTCQNGLLNVSAHRVPIRRVLEEIGPKADVRMMVTEGVPETLVSADLTKVPVAEAVLQLITPNEAFFYYAADTQAVAKLRTVWVYPQGTASGLRPVPPEMWAGRKELEAALGSPDPQVRGQAYEALIGRQDDRSRALVLQTLSGRRETNDGVRHRILSLALQKGMPVPAEVLAVLARTDPSENIRWTALDALYDETVLKAVAETAQADASEAIRERAKRILESLKAAAERPQIVEDQR